MAVFLIAECGSSHDSSWDKAVRLVQLAADCGFDCAKFQFFSDPDKLAARRNADAYRDVYRRYQIPEEWLLKLSRLCVTHGIEFMATCYLEEDIAVVAPHVKRFKISSFEARDKAFLDAHKLFVGQPVIVSTGMMREVDVLDLLRPFIGAILHCTSAYPCPPSDVNLNWLKLYAGRRTLKPLGLSDHTCNVLTGALAVAAGAEVVEVHIRLGDTDCANPDFSVSLSPTDAKEYVDNIRIAEQMMGSGLKEVQPSEDVNLPYRVRA